jgi:hypothetical protein
VFFFLGPNIWGYLDVENNFNMDWFFEWFAKTKKR